MIYMFDIGRVRSIPKYSKGIGAHFAVSSWWGSR